MTEGICFKSTYLGVVIYKIQDDTMTHEEAQTRCNQHSDEAGFSGFLHLPMPRNEKENQIYFDIIKSEEQYVWLDIAEVQPSTSPRSWVYKDGLAATWTNWNSGEPNNYGGSSETQAEMQPDNGKWNDAIPSYINRRAVCTYFLPSGSEKKCPWLYDYDGKYFKCILKLMVLFFKNFIRFKTRK